MVKHIGYQKQNISGDMHKNAKICEIEEKMSYIAGNGKKCGMRAIKGTNSKCGTALAALR